MTKTGHNEKEWENKMIDNDNCIIDDPEITFVGGKKGYEFRLRQMPETFEGFRDFFAQFIDAFDVSFTLTADKFERFRNYAEPSSIKEVNNLF